MLGVRSALSLTWTMMLCSEHRELGTFLSAGEAETDGPLRLANSQVKPNYWAAERPCLKNKVDDTQGSNPQVDLWP